MIILSNSRHLKAMIVLFMPHTIQHCKISTGFYLPWLWHWKICSEATFTLYSLNHQNQPLKPQQEFIK